jgi:defect-in-organelle-trafficking protein DotC
MVATHYSLQNLESLSQKSAVYQTAPAFMNIRIKAIKQAAQSVGMQAGLAAEATKVNGVLDARAHELNTIYNFNILLYKNNVLPPVIEEANNSVRIGDKGDMVRIGGTTYKIIRQVKFVTTPPTWRTYLWMSFAEPQLPNQVLLPRTSAERAMWQANVNKGWQEGVTQAVGIYKINLNRLTRDYNGMVLYKKLLSQNLVSPFYVTKKKMGITGNSKEMIIDDQSWQITDKPALQVHSKLWQPVLVPKQGA